MKKIFALILLLSILTLSVFAVDITDIKDNVNEKAITTLVDYGVVDGYPDGTYQPDKNISRAEVAKLLVCAMQSEIPAAVKPVFTDVDETHWAIKFVNAAAENKIVNGFGNGTFKPNANVTFEQMATMILNVLGYNVVGEDWNVKATEYALALGLSEKVTARGTDLMTRGEVAQMIYNALDCHFVEVYNGKVYEKEAILADNFGYKYTVSMDTSTVETFGNYVKHYERGVKPDEIISTSVNAIATISYGKTVFVVLNEKGDKVLNVYELNSDTAIYYNGGKVTAAKITKDMPVKLILLDDKLVDVVIWEETDRVVTNELTAKYYSGEFVPNQSVVMYFGYNYAIVCNKTVQATIALLTETTDEYVAYCFNLTVPVVVPKWDAEAAANIKMAYDTKTPITVRYAGDGEIYDFVVDLPINVYIERIAALSYLNTAVNDIDGKSYELAAEVDIEEYFATLYPSMDAITVAAGELDNEYVITFYKNIYTATATVEIIRPQE